MVYKMLTDNVVHVITGTAIGGAEMMLFRYLRAIGDHRSRHSVVSMMPPGPVADRIKGLGVPVDSLNVRSVLDLPSGVLRLRRMIGDGPPACLHGWMYHGSLVATLALRMSGRTDMGLVWAIHHSLSEPRREKPTTRAVLHLLRRLSDRPDAITYCARLSRDQHRAFGLSARRDHVVPNAIGLDEFAPDPLAAQRLREAARIPPGRRIVGTVARAHPMKDHEGFARAIAHLVRDGHDVHGVLIGSGQPDGPAMRTARAAGIADRLSALPARADIPALVPGLDVYLLSSAWGEALPLSVAEAMAAGVPAVVTDIGDCAWLVGEAGAVCPPRRPDLLAGAVADILALPPAGYRALALRARARIGDTMSMTDYAARHLAIHAEACARRVTLSGMGQAA